MLESPIRFTQTDPQQLPMSLDLEEKLLGSLMLDPACVMAAVIDQGFVAEALYMGHHQTIFRTCCELYHRGIMPDLGMVATTLRQSDQLDKVGGQNRLADLLESASSAVMIDQYIGKLLDDYRRRQTIRILDEAIVDCRDPNIKLSETIEKAAQATHALTVTNQQYTMASMAQVSAELMLDLESQKQPLVTTGLKELDRMIGGFSPGYWVAAGRASMGKTHVLVHLAHEMAKQSKPVLYISCEMAKDRIGRRLLARQARIDSSRLRRKQITESEWVVIGQAMQDLAQLPLEIYDHPNPSEINIHQKIRQLTSTYGQSPGLIVVDYLQKLWWDNNGRTRAEQLEKTSAALCAMSTAYNATVLVGAQINRGVEGRSDKRPTMADIRDSGAVEQDADVVLTLYRDEYYNPATDDRNVTEIDIAKGRDDRTGKIRVLHDLKFGHYFDLTNKPLDF